MPTRPAHTSMARATLLALAALWPAACVDLPTQASNITPVGAPDYQQFDKSIAKYPYRASARRSAEIKSGLARARQCMTKSEVRALLGTPDAGRQTYDAKDQGERWLGSSWTYYLSKRGQGVNINDMSVEVFFDTRDRAYWIVSFHVRNAMDIGSPNGQCAAPRR